MRGKHSVSAGARHAIEERESQLDMHQRRVVRLTSENRALRDRLDAQQRTHAQEVKRLKAERDEGLSPTVRVLQRENAALKERLDRAERNVKDLQRRWTSAMERLISHFQGGHSFTRLEAVEAMLHLLEPDTVGTRVYDRGRYPGLNDPDRVETLQRVRGERR